jgi:hypothetical protein
VILKFEEKPNVSTKAIVRRHGLKWNKLRCEWYGYVVSVSSLKDDLDGVRCSIE